MNIKHTIVAIGLVVAMVVPAGKQDMMESKGL